MSIIRTAKTDNYTVICNQCLRDESLSARAKGIFSYLMTLPDDWKLYKSELTKHFKEGRDALNTAFSELEEAGYVSKVLDRKGDGTVDGWVYTIYESTDLLENRNTVNPSDGESASTKYLSTLNTELTNVADAPEPVIEKKENNNPKPSLPPKKKNPPTAAEVKAWADGWAKKKGKNPATVCRVAEEARAYYDRLDWKDSQGSKVKAWKQKIVAVWFKDDKLCGSGQKHADLSNF